jgi:hypothetical protein
MEKELKAKQEFKRRQGVEGKTIVEEKTRR